MRVRRGLCERLELPSLCSGQGHCRIRGRDAGSAAEVRLKQRAAEDGGVVGQELLQHGDSDSLPVDVAQVRVTLEGFSHPPFPSDDPSRFSVGERVLAAFREFRRGNDVLHETGTFGIGVVEGLPRLHGSGREGRSHAVGILVLPRQHVEDGIRRQVGTNGRETAVDLADAHRHGLTLDFTEAMLP